MDWEYVILNHRNLVSVRATGKFSTALFEQMIKDIQSDNQWRPNMDCLVDFTSLDLTETTSNDIFMAADIHKRYDSIIGCGRVAMIFGREEDFGLGRLYENFLRPKVLATVRSFRTADDARHWLAANVAAQSNH